MTYRALLIGNSVFDADAGLNPLNAPVKDVARLHRALVDEETGLFGDEDVRLVTERTCDDVLDELDRFFEAGRKDDLMLLYYSGHGVLDERNNLYLCGRDTRSDRLLRTAVSNVRINEFVAHSLAQRIVILLDCCSSGMFKGTSVGPQLAGPGRYIVSSTRGADLANDAATSTGTSLFTEHLVEGLLGAAQDRNGDGFVDLREVYDYVRDQLLATTKQVPHCRFDGDAAVSMARTRVAPRVGRTPPDGQPRTTEPTFALAENTITLRDVELDEELQPEVIEVIKLGDAALDLIARAEDDWLHATVSNEGIVVVLRPRLGSNRGKVIVRDRASGNTQVLRVEARVRASTAKGVPPNPPQTDLPPPIEPPSDPRDTATAAAAPTASYAPSGLDWGQHWPQDAGPPPLPSAEQQGSGSPTVKPAKSTPAVAVGWVGLSIAVTGTVLLFAGFGSAWYRDDSGTSIHIGAISNMAGSLGAGFTHAFFGGLWLLPALLSIALAVAACLPVGQAAKGLARSAAVVAVIGLLMSAGALAEFSSKAHSHPGSVEGFKAPESGVFLAVIGFLLIAVAGRFRRPKTR